MTRAEAWADRSRGRWYAYEFLWFGLKQGWACLFGGAMLGLILATDVPLSFHPAATRVLGLVTPRSVG